MTGPEVTGEIDFSVHGARLMKENGWAQGLPRGTDLEAVTKALGLAYGAALLGRLQELLRKSRIYFKRRDDAIHAFKKAASRVTTLCDENAFLFGRDGVAARVRESVRKAEALLDESAPSRMTVQCDAAFDGGAGRFRLLWGGKRREPKNRPRKEWKAGSRITLRRAGIKDNSLASEMLTAIEREVARTPEMVETLLDQIGSALSSGN